MFRDWGGRGLGIWEAEVQGLGRQRFRDRGSGIREAEVQGLGR